MRAVVIGNSLEVRLARGEVLLLGLSFLMIVALGVLAGWEIAAVALGVSVAGAGIVELAEHQDR